MSISEKTTRRRREAIIKACESLRETMFPRKITLTENREETFFSRPSVCDDIATKERIPVAPKATGLIVAFLMNFSHTNPKVISKLS